MRNSVAAVVAICLGSACTHRHTVGRLQPLSPSMSATAELVTGEELRVQAVSTGAGLIWIAQDPTALGPSGISVDAAQLRSFTIVNHARGGAEGLLIGGLSGVVLGGAIGYASGDDTCNDDFCVIQFSAGDKAFIYGVAIGTLGLLVGGVIGLSAGSRDVYEFEAESPYVPRVVPMAGPGQAGAELSWWF